MAKAKNRNILSRQSKSDQHRPLNLTQLKLIDRWYFDEKKSQKEIATLLNIGSTTVYHHTRKRLKLPEPKKNFFSERNLRYMAHYKVKHGLYFQEMKEELCLECSESYMRNELQRTKYIVRKPKSYAFKLSENHKIARKKFAKKILSLPDPDRFIKSIFFSDESLFKLFGKTKAKYVYQYKDNPVEPQPLDTQSKSVMIWGMISYQSKYPLFAPMSRYNSTMYKNRVLMDFVTPVFDSHQNDYIFQQDNSPVHTAKRVTDYIKTQRIQTLEWPAKSPDLNLIEHVWADLKNTIYKQGNEYNSENDLLDAIRDAWNDYDQSKITAMYDSYTNRLNAIVKANGGHINY